MRLIYTNTYSTHVKNKIIIVKGNNIPACPCCGGKLLKNGSRLRSAMNMGKERHIYCLRRFRCKICNRVHHELPSCLLPKKRYETEIYEHVIAGQLDGIECDEKTIVKIQQWGKSLRKIRALLCQNKICSGVGAKGCEVSLLGARLPDKGWLYFLVNQFELKYLHLHP